MSLCAHTSISPSLWDSLHFSLHTHHSISLSLSICDYLPLHMSLCLSLYTLVCAYRERHREGLRERERDVCVEEDLSLSSKNETLIQRAKKAKARIKYMKGFDFSVRFAFFCCFYFWSSLSETEKSLLREGLCVSLCTHLHLSISL